MKVISPRQGKKWMESLMHLPAQNIVTMPTYDPSTGRQYSLEVDPSCSTTAEAQRYLVSPEIALDGLGIDIDKVKNYPVLRT